MIRKTAKWACGVTAIVGLTIALHGNELQTSEKALLLIGNAEGCQRMPYTCPADVLTFGIGTTEAVQKIDRNKIYSDEEIATAFAKGIKQAEKCVNTYANGQVMPQGAFDSLVSITFNIGCGTMKSSTLFKMALQGYSKAMCQQFPRWIYANGKPLKGLIERREKERALCLAS
ncbi:lysozyme [Aggregatibacter actinomycetemcomitans]|uniref:lysozyme n=1 Tax=Aggregatibacter actinomycetemcomitans TaxID=714 RepID=UPI00197C1BC2|nr:lysozyme [Aggregatibacter actinomycetemcomitans]MBN6064185.1 lysozyme [Aggregatibacter actinomycetemcomitans]MBN6081262.1 lysozyme [Aggregatibacter actinomycetemcomitans]MBN6084028.1 lysozyme [Aggregatibacter actinomycetemcomitans]